MKKQMLFISIAILFCMVFMFAMIHNQNHKEKKKEYGSITIMGTEEEYGDKENISYYSDTGGDLDSEIIKDTTNTVFIANEQILFENGMDDYGINSLDDYLLRYLNYYIGENIYYVTIEEDSYVGDSNYPIFHLQLTINNDTEKVYDIKCIYKKPYKRYLFYCNEIGIEKENF